MVFLHKFLIKNHKVFNHQINIWLAQRNDGLYLTNHTRHLLCLQLKPCSILVAPNPHHSSLPLPPLHPRLPLKQPRQRHNQAHNPTQQKKVKQHTRPTRPILPQPTPRPPELLQPRLDPLLRPSMPLTIPIRDIVLIPSRPRVFLPRSKPTRPPCRRALSRSLRRLSRRPPSSISASAAEARRVLPPLRAMCPIAPTAVEAGRRPAELSSTST